MLIAALIIWEIFHIETFNWFWVYIKLLIGILVDLGTFEISYETLEKIHMILPFFSIGRNVRSSITSARVFILSHWCLEEIIYLFIYCLRIGCKMLEQCIKPRTMSFTNTVNEWSWHSSPTLISTNSLKGIFIVFRLMRSFQLHVHFGTYRLCCVF